MREYENKQALVREIEKTALLFIGEFAEIREADRDLLVDGIDKTPAQMISYQLGWLDLVMEWDRDEAAGERVVTPSKNYQWNALGGLYRHFYDQYASHSLSQLEDEFKQEVSTFIKWLGKFSEDELFVPGGRKWASSTPSNWPIWKWVHINTVAPFKSFRTKIRKWKRLRAQENSPS